MLSSDVEMNCNTPSKVSYAFGHVGLPAGWFLLCGRTVCSYLPANNARGQCFLGRLTVFLSQKMHTTQAQW